MKGTLGSWAAAAGRVVLVATALAALVVVAPAGPASAGPCLLNLICPPTTPPKTAPPTTHPPATTAPPATHPPATARTTPTTAKRAINTQPNVGATGVLPPINLPPLGTNDQTAPVLANTPTASTTPPVIFSPQLLPGLAGSVATPAPPAHHHAAARIAFSLIVLIVAAVAIGQLPASRRTPRPARELQ